MKITTKEIILLLPLFIATLGCRKFQCPEPKEVTKMTLKLQPGPAEGKDVYVWYVTDQTTSHGPTNSTNYATDGDFTAQEWTYQSSPGRKKSLLEFDLTSIPTEAKVNKATLYLYHNPGANPAGHSQLSGSNEGVLRRITSAWDENTVTWNTQPSVTKLNELTIPASTSNTQDYIIDVTAMIQDMVTFPKNNYGFMLSMKTSSFYRSLVFSSSDHPDPLKWPKLEVDYEY